MSNLLNDLPLPSGLTLLTVEKSDQAWIIRAEGQSFLSALNAEPDRLRAIVAIATGPGFADPRQTSDPAVALESMAMP
jgi:hypothetical protein